MPEKRTTKTGIEIQIPSPPLAPREVPKGYLWQVMKSEVTPLIGGIFAPLGMVFGVIGCVLLFVFLPVGLPFTLIGVVFTSIGIPLFIVGYNKAQQTVQVLQNGETAEGEIIDVYQDQTLSVNGRHPWVVEYEFTIQDEVYVSKMRSLERRLPDHLQVDAPAYVLFSPGDPKVNTLFPPLR